MVSRWDLQSVSLACRLFLALAVLQDTFPDLRDGAGCPSESPLSPPCQLDFCPRGWEEVRTIGLGQAAVSPPCCPVGCTGSTQACARGLGGSHPDGDTVPHWLVDPSERVGQGERARACPGSVWLEGQSRERLGLWFQRWLMVSQRP